MLSLFYQIMLIFITVKPVLSSHSKIDKTKILKPCGSSMQVKSTAECCNTFTCIKRVLVLKTRFNCMAYACVIHTFFSWAGLYYFERFINVVETCLLHYCFSWDVYKIMLQ